MVIGESLVRGALVSQKGLRRQLFLFGRSLSNCKTFIHVSNVVFGTYDRTDGFVLVLLL